MKTVPPAVKVYFEAIFWNLIQCIEKNFHKNLGKTLKFAIETPKNEDFGRVLFHPGWAQPKSGPKTKKVIKNNQISQNLVKI